MGRLPHPFIAFGAAMVAVAAIGYTCTLMREAFALALGAAGVILLVKGFQCIWPY